MKISDPWISKEKFKNISKIKEKISYDAYIEFIDTHQDYFTWEEETEQGKNTLKNLDEIPKAFRDGILKSHSKQKANAEFNLKKRYYEVVVQFNEELGVIRTTFQKKIKKHHLELLLEMANYLDALLLVDGTKIINKETLKNEIS
ncbi:hypothetical protein [Cellulophaga omnivescoria]|uniref:hypothetical protein n=1 Tax=Cellulophaga omnivescoria TaxID=1888890 RepID=UPI000985F2C6|nr:hypothetical protein [Cellulophaga omnivescoria]